MKSSPTAHMLAAVRSWLHTDSWGPWIVARFRRIESYLEGRAKRDE